MRIQRGCRRRLKEAVADATLQNTSQEIAQRILALPDLEHAKTAVLNSLTSASGQRTYDHAIREFVRWYCSEPRGRFPQLVDSRSGVNRDRFATISPSFADLYLRCVLGLTTSLLQQHFAEMGQFRFIAFGFLEQPAVRIGRRLVRLVRA